MQGVTMLHSTASASVPAPTSPAKRAAVAPSAAARRPNVFTLADAPASQRTARRTCREDDGGWISRSEGDEPSEHFS